MNKWMITGAAALWMSAAYARPEAPDTIVVKNFMFPTDLTVKAGTKVTWTNEDEEPHTIASSDGLFRSAALDTHESYSFRFEQPGTYHYLCTIHPQMIGTITVR